MLQKFFVFAQSLQHSNMALLKITLQAKLSLKIYIFLKFVSNRNTKQMHKSEMKIYI